MKKIFIVAMRWETEASLLEKYLQQLFITLSKRDIDTELSHLQQLISNSHKILICSQSNIIIFRCIL